MATSTTQSPPIRNAQMETSGAASIAKSVNLFRGDVNLTQSLVSLPGPSDAMSVSIAIQYQSNVALKALQDNVQAPTSVIGLGWSLPLTYIERSADLSPIASTRRYTLYDNGSANQLVRQSWMPTLFSISDAKSCGLVDGSTVPSKVQNQFLANGLALSSTTKTTLIASNKWWLADDKLQQEYTLVVSDDENTLYVHDGGEIYQATNYNFEKILYYPGYERWVIVGVHGVRKSFGGRTDNLNGYAQSAGNSIRWEVWKRSPNGQPLGFCTVANEGAANQVQVAAAWYCCQIQDRYGNAITCSYNPWKPNDTTHIVQEAEQFLGEGGLPYTTAMYLGKIVDAAGHTITFDYKAKNWSDEQREYVDPHCNGETTPRTGPSNYQTPYETFSLYAIKVKPTGSSQNMFDIMFGHEVTNVTNYTGDLKRDTYKRFLAYISQESGGGIAGPKFPRIKFTYDQSPQDPRNPSESHQAGALLTQQTAQGALTTYTYERESYDVLKRTAELDRPAQLNGASPRVYFGPDYSATLFTNPSSTGMSLQIDTWDGRWIPWDPGEILDNSTVRIETLEVLATQDFVAISFLDGDWQFKVYAFQRDPSQPGQWQFASVYDPDTGDVQTIAANTSLEYPSQASLYGGTSFFSVLQTYTGDWSLAGYADTFTYDWVRGQLVRARIELSRFAWAVAGENYLALLTTDSQYDQGGQDDLYGQLQVHTVDEMSQWSSHNPVKVDLQVSDAANLAMAGGSHIIAVSQLLATGAETTLQPTIVEWDAGYAFQVYAFDSTTTRTANGQTPPWYPVVVEDTLVGICGHVFRASASGWEQRDDLVPVDDTPITQSYSYGADFAVQLAATDDGKVYNVKVLSYDASIGVSENWSLSEQLNDNDANTLNQTTDAQVSVNGSDWLVIGSLVYFRGAANNWGEVLQQAAVYVISDENFISSSLINQGPDFITYGTGTGEQRELRILRLLNGEVLDDTVYSQERLADNPGYGMGAPGNQMFASFSGSGTSFDSADSVTLHKFAAGNVTGAIHHYPVTQVTFDDGINGPFVSTIYRDTSTVGCDSSGSVVQYYASSVYIGSETTTANGLGWVERMYYNGMIERTGTDYYRQLDGVLIRIKVFDQSASEQQPPEPIYSKDLQYQVYTQAAMSPSTTSGCLQLRGSVVLPTQTTVVSNGVTTVTTTDYATSPEGFPFNGQKLAQHRDQTAHDTSESYTRTYSYVQQVDEQSSIAIGAIADVAQVVDTRATSAGTTVLQAQATTRTGFKSAVPVDQGDVITPAPEAKWIAYGTANAFDFASYRTNQIPPAGWRTTQRLTGRTRTGQFLTAQDPMETNYVQLWDASGQLMVASFVDAQQEQCAYTGFQGYEDLSGWTSTPKQVYDNMVAYSGVQSGRFDPSSSIARTVSTVAGKMMIGVRSRFTQSGDDAPQVALSYTPPGGSETITSKDLETSGDDWLYTLLTIDTEAGGSLKVTFRNDTDETVWLDMIAIAPFKSAVTLTTYDPITHVLLTTQDASGRATRSTLTAWGANGFTMSPDSMPQSITVAGLVQPRVSNGKLNLTYPSCTVTLQSTDGGTIETFRDGAQWQSRWHVGSGFWGRNDGSLVNSKTSGSLVYRHPPTGDSCVLYVEPDLSTGQTFEIVLGGISIQWDGTNYSSPNGWTPLLSPSNYAQQWLAVLHHGHMYFFADGQLIFSAACESPEQTISISTGNGPVTVRNLTVTSGIRMGVTYADANGNAIQAHQLLDDDSLMSGRVFDPIGRQLATSRVVKGSQVSSQRMAFNPSLIDARTFVKGTQAMNNDDTWAMLGDVANNYPTDDHYPYYGVRFERSIRSKRQEVGCPGNEHGIKCTDSSSTLIDLGAAGENEGVTEGDRSISVYRAKGTDVQIHGEAARDRLNRFVGAKWEDTAGATLIEYGMARSYADINGPETSAELNLPQFYASSEETMQQSRTTDGAGNVIEMSDPDSGTTQLVYDAKNRLRFTIPSVSGKEQAFVLYTKFDRLGRELERGRLNGSYTRETLQNHADDLTWPSSGQQVTVMSTFDGDGSDAKAIGLLTTATTTTVADDGSTCVVKETYTYTPNGLPDTVEQTVSGIADHSAQIGYGYNNLGEVTTVTLPDGAGVSKLFYGYDGLGRTSTIGKTRGGSEFASFAYTPDGAISTAHGSDFWTTKYAYDPKNPTLPATITGTHTKLPGDTVITSTYNIDSSMHTRSVNAPIEGVPQISETFGYDGLRRLKTVTGSGGDSSTYTIDANGNITEVDDANGTTSMPRATGLNQIGVLTTPSGASNPFVYDARGQLTQDDSRTYTYEESISRPITVQSLDKKTSVQFGYGSRRQRAVKVSSSLGMQIYLSGGMPQSWIVYRNGDWYVDLNGPSGRLMTLVNGAPVVSLADLTGSVWATFDADGLQDSSSYGPYGESSSDSTMMYRYQGQEWDSEVGLYNFRARLYDPVTRRFTAPDPMRQLATPYAFAASNPLMLVDPTGEMSVWAEALVGVALTAAFVAGAALTGGAADAGLAALVGADAAETGAEVGVDATVELEAGYEADSEVDAGIDLTLEGSDSSGAMGEEEGEAEVQAGLSTEASFATKSIQTVTGVTGAALTGGSLNTQQYLLFHPASATWAGVGIHFGTGAAAGVIGYGLAAAAAAGTAYAVVATVGEFSLSTAMCTGISIATDVTISTGVNMTQKVVTNKILGNPLCDGLAKAALAGAVQGGIGAGTGQIDGLANPSQNKGLVNMVIVASEAMNVIADSQALDARTQASVTPSYVGPSVAWQQS